MAEPVYSLKGHAAIEWKYKKRLFRFDQAIVIQSLDRSTFETLDDFGNTVFKLGFIGDDLILFQGDEGNVYDKSKFKKLLSLPLSRDEFIKALFYRIPDVTQFKFKIGSNGTLEKYEKKTGKSKLRYKVIYSDFRDVNGTLYPFGINIVAKKTQLKIKWQSITINQ